MGGAFASLFCERRNHYFEKYFLVYQNKLVIMPYQFINRFFVHLCFQNRNIKCGLMQSY
jgi:hypothetical protein